VAIRGVEERLKWYRDHPPSEGGWCALKVMQALGAPKQGLPDATAVANVVIKAGRMRSGRAPRGAIVYWTGGAKGHGHTCFALGDGTERSVDVKGAGTVGDVPFGWFAKNWPALKYVGWSWYWGGIDTEPVKATEAPRVARKGKATTGTKVTWWRDYSDKPEASQGVPVDGKWHRVTGVELAAPSVSGMEFHMLYARLGITWPADATEHVTVQAKWVRDGGTPDDPADDDPTAYGLGQYAPGTTSVPFDRLHFEDGQKGVGGAWWITAAGGASELVITTRYAKTHVIAVAS